VKQARCVTGTAPQCLRPQTTLCLAWEAEVAACDARHVCGCSLNKLMWVLRRVLRRMCNCTF